MQYFLLPIYLQTQKQFRIKKYPICLCKILLNLFQDKEKSKIQENLILSPPISLTPKRTHIPRRSSPRFKDLFIRYRPKTLIGRNTTPKTYSSPRDKNRILKVKHEIDERRIKNKQNDLIFKDEVFNDVNDVFNQSLNNDVTPIALQDELYPEDLVNIYEVVSSNSILMACPTTG